MEGGGKRLRDQRGDLSAIKPRDDIQNRGRGRDCHLGSETPSMADISFIGAVKDEWQLYRFFNFVSIHIYFTYHFL